MIENEVATLTPYNPNSDMEKFVDQEGKRLAAMDEWLSGHSLGAIDPQPGDRILDAGGGASTTLDLLLLEQGVSSIFALDINPKLLSQREKSFQLPGDITNIPMQENSVDTSHARAVLGWLNEEDQIQAYEELARVTEPGGKIVVIDFDWGVVKGGTGFQAFKFSLNSILAQAGFDPGYGRKQGKDIERLIEGRDDIGEIVHSEETPDAENPADIVGGAAESLIAMLYDDPRTIKFGDMVSSQYRAIAPQLMGDNFTLPTINTTTIHLLN